MESTPHIYAYGATDTGRKRPLNEDSYFIDLSSGCFAVSDGVGGASAGEVASGIFTSTVSKLFNKEPTFSEETAISTIKKVFLESNSKIIRFAEQNPTTKGMACTADLLVMTESSFVLGHVGDSRTYRFRKNKLTKLTKDHSFVQEQIDRGTITDNDAKRHRYRNVILRAVGMEESLDVDIVRGGSRQGDIFLLCSDGLTDMLSETEITRWLESEMSLKEKVSSLINQANQAGGNDNITVILATIG